MKALVLLGMLTLALEAYPAETHALGAKVYFDRCMLCHGAQGMGEGLLPLKLKDYPKTNLMSVKTLEYDYTYDVVKYGGIKRGLSDLMPPMQDELSEKELSAVSHFVLALRNDNATYVKLLQQLIAESQPNIRTGEQIYSTRCVLCHGARGEGDGRMSRIVKTPPPADLTKSKADLKYIKAIVKNGGEPMGRSPQMPPWGDQLSESELESLAIYVLNLQAE